MRFLATIVGLAVFLIVTYLVLSWFVDGYFGGNIFRLDEAVPDAWTAPDSWSEWRDILLVFTAAFWMLAGVLMVALVAVLVVLAFVVKRLVQEHVTPAVDSLKGSLDNLKGTTETVGESVVSPIIRVYSVVSGVRAGIGAIGHLPDRVRGRKKKKGRFGR